jgi:hypothetical protein
MNHTCKKLARQKREQLRQQLAITCAVPCASLGTQMAAASSRHSLLPTNNIKLLHHRWYRSWEKLWRYLFSFHRFWFSFLPPNFPVSSPCEINAKKMEVTPQCHYFTNLKYRYLVVIHNNLLQLQKPFQTISIFGTLVKMQTFFHLHLWDRMPMGDSHFEFRGPLRVVENQATQTGCLVQSLYNKNH